MAPPWGSEVRLNNTPGGLDDPFLGSGQTNIFPVTFDQNAPFSRNGPFLSLSNDMVSTNVHLWNVTLERQVGPRWVTSVGYVGSRTNNIWESTPLNNAIPGTALLNNRRPLFLADSVNGSFYGPLDLYVTDGKQRYNGMILSVRGTGSVRVDRRRELHVVALLWLTRWIRRRDHERLIRLQQARGPRLRRRQLHGGQAP